MNVDSLPRTLCVATLIAFTCSTLVVTAVTILRPMQEANAQIERNRAIVTTAHGTGPDELTDREIVARYLELDAHVVDITTGQYVPDVDALTFSHWDEAVSSSDDSATENRSNQVPVYLVRKELTLERIVLPVDGPAMWSTVYGYVALHSDLVTIADIVFFRHGETPGIGDRIQDAGWRQAWQDKRIYDDNGVLQIDVVENARGPYEVDLISGASITSDAVGDMVRDWFDDDGYRSFLQQLRREEMQ
jgi:Na+-transporting NADH:ubiquinone oxidoreductase subunit C